MGKFLNMNPSMKMGRNGESKLSGFQKYKEHEKWGLGSLKTLAMKIFEVSTGQGREWADFGSFFRFYFI